MKFPKISNKVILGLKKSTPTILSCIGVVGIVATTVLAVKATPKAMEAIKTDSRVNHDGDPNAATKLEAIKSGWKFYIPATITGAATIICIFGANVLNRRQQASLASAYALVNRSYNDYKRKVIDLYGRDAHNKVIESIAAEEVDKDHTIYAQHLAGTSCLEFEDANEEERLFYDAFSERYFTSTISKVLQAEYHLNRNFALCGGGVTLNHFYNLLGLDGIEEGDCIGWFVNDDMYWVDFNHMKTVLDDGLECWIIDMIYTPGTYEEYCK